MLDDILRRTDGVITGAQAQSAGLSQDAIERRVRSGHWRRCAKGVYFVDDRPFNDAARIRVGVLRHGPLASASGLAAAWWHQLTKFAPAVVDVTVPRNNHGRRRDGSRVRRRDLHPRDVVERHGLRVTALGLTVVEAAVRRGGGPMLMDTALQRHTDLDALWSAHLRNKGRYGSPAARRLLLAAHEGTRSEAERLFARLLKEAGLTGWTANHPVAGYLIDFAFIGSRVAIEIDGLAYHTDAQDFQRDRNRQNVIALAGWQVLRFTWLDLTQYPDRVLADVKRAISAR